MGPLTPVAVALALCALVLPVSIAATNMALGALTLALLLRARADGRRLLEAWKTPALAAVALYAAAGLTAALFGADPHAALCDALKDFHRVWALGLFLAAAELEPEAPVLEALAVSFAAMAAYGICQTALGGMPGGRIIRAHGFVHPVVYGQQMALGLLGGLCVLARPGGLAVAVPLEADSLAVTRGHRHGEPDVDPVGAGGKGVGGPPPCSARCRRRP